MKRIISIAIALMLTLGILSGFGVLASADDTSPSFSGLELPEVSLGTGIYSSLESMGVDAAYIASLLPKTLPHTYENGVMTVEGDSPSNVKLYAASNWYYFTREGDRFVCDVPAEVYNAGYVNVEVSIGNYTLSYSNYELNVILIDDKRPEEKVYNTLFIYPDGDINHMVEYTENGIESMLNVGYNQNGNYQMCEIRRYYANGYVNVNYNSTRSFSYAYVYADDYGAYYVDGYGWRNYDHHTAPEVDAPAGYEDANTDYFTTLSPCIVPCDHSVWVDASCAAPKHCTGCLLSEGEALPHNWVGDGSCQDPGHCTSCGLFDDEVAHSWVDATCVKPKHCSDCALVDGVVLEHSWAETDEGTVCSACGTVFGKLNPPKYTEDITVVRETLGELGIDHYTAVNAFPENIEMSYENGVFYITDVGCDDMSFFSFLTYQDYKCTLVDGKWQAEIPADAYERGGIVYAYCGNWNVIYRGGVMESALYSGENNDGLSFNIEFTTDRVRITTSKAINEVYYYVETAYTKTGKLDIHNVTGFVNDCQVATEYNAERMALFVTAYSDGWFYMFPDGNWHNNANPNSEACDAPEAFEGMSFEELAAFNPCFIDCGDHVPAYVYCEENQYCTVCNALVREAKDHTWQSATCTSGESCSDCGAIASEPNGHSWTEATCDAPKACKNCGETEGEAIGHSYEAAVTAPTCRYEGYTTYTCTACGHNYTDDATSALGHDWADPICGQHSVCNVCGEGSEDILEHDWIDATYEAPKTCARCDKTEGEPLERAEETSDKEADETDAETTPAQNETDAETALQESATENKSPAASSENGNAVSGCGASMDINLLAVITACLLGVYIVRKTKDK